MLRPLPDMPPGTLGFEAVGDVDDDDWERTVQPVLRDAVAAGGGIRLLYLLGPRSGEIDEDLYGAEAAFRARHVTAYERLAIVSDEDWLRPALRALSFLLPGKARGFPSRELEAAKRWVADEG